MNPVMYEENSSLISEFKSFLSSTCTFLENGKDDIITPTTYRLYGKKYPARKASIEYIEQVQSHLSEDSMRISVSNDKQIPQFSHQEW